MAALSPTPRIDIDHAMKAEFLRQAAKYQEASRCTNPQESQTAANIARKYLFYVIDEMTG